MTLIWLLVLLVLLGLAIIHWQITLVVLALLIVWFIVRRQTKAQEQRDAEQAHAAAAEAFVHEWRETVFTPGSFTVKLRAIPEPWADADRLAEFLQLVPVLRDWSRDAINELLERVIHGFGPQAVAEEIGQHDAILLKTELEARGAKVKITEGAPKGTGAREPIPAAVRREVWRRDGGQCVDCGSHERLEYDHIVPVSRGGANTLRNIELRCEVCNRKKAASV